MYPPQQDVIALTADTACDAFRAAGMASDSGDLRVERRDDRWAVMLPGDRMAWFPANAPGRQQLSIERKVLRLLAERCTFGAPRVLFESPAGFDVRAIVPGRTDPWGVFAEARQDAALARRLGQALGNILVEQHMRITRTDVAGWLPQRVSWPEPSSWIRER